MTEPSFDGLATRPPSDQRLDVRFTGSGSEYFRIWIVNLLLTLVTFGLYYPWAKVRRMRYFYGNTVVGSHPLGFHAQPSKMLRGYLLVALLLVLYSVAGQFSPLAGLGGLRHRGRHLAGAAQVVDAVPPGQHQLARTAVSLPWHGGRRVHGTAADVRAGTAVRRLPWSWLSLIRISLPQWFGAARAGGGHCSPQLLLPWLWWNLKKYQHDHYAYGPEQTSLVCRHGRVLWRLRQDFGGVMLLGLVVLVALIGAIAFLQPLSATCAAAGRGSIRCLPSGSGHRRVGSGPADAAPAAQALLHLAPAEPAVVTHRQPRRALRERPAVLALLRTDAEELAADGVHARPVLAICRRGNGTHASRSQCTS